MKIIYIIRHGEVEKNFPKSFRGKKCDCELSNKGIVQSKEIAKFLNNIKIDICITTGLKRTDFISQFLNHNIKNIIEPNLKEIDFGLWDNLRIEDIENNFPEDLKNYYNFWETGQLEKISFPEGENYQSFFKRIKTSWDKLKNKSFKQMAIVGHSFSNACLHSIINNQPLHTCPIMKYGSMTKICLNS